MTLALIGNPNCGKTTIFNALTGAKQRVGNWPGVTVERKTGTLSLKKGKTDLIDIPGIYSLSPSASISLDQRIARNYVLSSEASLLINVIDAVNLDRHLFLTLQLREMGIPMIVVLNMMDIAEKKNLCPDPKILEKRLGCPVIPIVANRKADIKRVLELIDTHQAEKSPLALSYPEEVEMEIAAHMEDGKERYAALSDLEEHATEEKPDILPLMAGTRTKIAREIAHAVYASCHLPTTFSKSDKIDRLLLNPLLGIPVFLCLMYFMFIWAIAGGGAFIDLFDILGGALFVDLPATLLSQTGLPPIVTTLLADGIGGGLQTVATFIPPIAFLFLFLSALEESGYMTRAALTMDRFMRRIGLPGKAFVPLIVGFGCTVPAVLATRTLDSERDRKLTIMMSPFMSCGARIPVYALLAAAFFPTGGQNLVFSLYLIGILIALFTGFVLKKTLLKGRHGGLVMELPTYHMPTPGAVLIATWLRLKAFIINASRIIIPITLLLAFLSAPGADKKMSDTLLAQTGRALTPIFQPMGISEDNWPATVALFTGVLAKEAVVGTLDALYTEPKHSDEEDLEIPALLTGALTDARDTTWENITGLSAAFSDPFGLQDAINAENPMETDASFGAMVEKFDGKAGAFAYLIFILLYAPCAAAIGAIYKETNFLWASFSVFWTTSLGYICGTSAYQIAVFERNPTFSSLWLSGMAIALFGVIAVLRFVSRKNLPPVKGNDPVLRFCQANCPTCHEEIAHLPEVSPESDRPSDETPDPT